MTTIEGMLVAMAVGFAAFYLFWRCHRRQTSGGCGASDTCGCTARLKFKTRR